MDDLIAQLAAFLQGLNKEIAELFGLTPVSVWTMLAWTGIVFLIVVVATLLIRLLEWIRSRQRRGKDDDCAAAAH